MKTYHILFSLIAVLLIRNVMNLSNDECIVSNDHYKITGFFDPVLQTCSFKNLKFGQDTSGANRWREPLASHQFFLSNKSSKKSYRELIDATKFGKSCPQHCILPVGKCPISDDHMSEDCLNLNVYTPSELIPSMSKVPVIVFIPGGHFDQGSANCDVYDGRRFVYQSKKIIMVTINYRLGALGLMAEKSRQLYGNFAIQDQRLALEWIRQNIGLFGGDPNQICIIGESAGASSVGAHLISPLSRDLFHKAVMTSNPSSLPYRSLNDASILGNHFVKLAKCEDDYGLGCIRNLTVRQVIQYQEEAAKKIDLLNPITVFMPWVPTINVTELPLHPLEAFQTGNYHKVPIMIGTVSEEAIMFIYLAFKKPLSLLGYEALLSSLFLKHLIRVNELYPPLDDDKRIDASILATDCIFIAPSRNISLSVAKNNYITGLSSKMSTQDIYLFQFNHSAQFDMWGENYTFCRGHVCHGSELPYLFNTSWVFGVNFTDQEKDLTYSLVAYWTNFATTGNPNRGPLQTFGMDSKPDKQLPIWLPFDTHDMHHMQFNTDLLHNDQFLRKKYCDAWDQMGYHFGQYNSRK